MKKIMYLLLISFLLIIPIKCLALTSNPVITCNTKTLTTGQQANCEFRINVSDGKINAVSAKYFYDSDYINVSVKNAGTWLGDSSNNIIDYYNDTDYNGNVLIATIIIKAKDNITTDLNSSFSVKLIEVGDENFVAHYPNIISEVTFKIKSNNTPITTTTQDSVKTTTKASSNSTTKKTTKKNSTTTKEEQITTTNTSNNQENSTTKLTSTKKSVTKTNNNEQKEKTKSIVVILFLVLLFLLLLILFLIIFLRKNQKDKKEKEV